MCVCVKTCSCATFCVLFCTFECVNFNIRAAEFPANTLRVINIHAAQNSSRLLTHQKTLTHSLLSIPLHTHTHSPSHRVLCLPPSLASVAVGYALLVSAGGWSQHEQCFLRCCGCSIHQTSFGPAEALLMAAWKEPPPASGKQTCSLHTQHQHVSVPIRCKHTLLCLCSLFVARFLFSGAGFPELLLWSLRGASAELTGASRSRRNVQILENICTFHSWSCSELSALLFSSLASAEVLFTF